LVGRERTRADFAALFAAAGLRPTRALGASTVLAVIEAVAKGLAQTGRSTTRSGRVPGSGRSRAGRVEGPGPVLPERCRLFRKLVRVHTY
jgi:hypothetical protein